MKKINIKGKDYIEVNERIKEFHNLYPNGSIETELIEMTDRFITKTNVIPDVKNSERKFTGIAYEKEDSSFINKTSALENCETSSVGRALGMLGIGIDTSVASYDEVANAIEQQESPSEPKINLKDQEVPNPLFEEAKKKFDGKVLESDNNKSSNKWDGSEVVRFGKYENNSGDKEKDISWAKLPKSYLEFIVEKLNSKELKDKAQLELDRRKNV